MVGKREGNHGFTLLEMMLVIAVIGILLGVLIPQFAGVQDEARGNRANADLRTLATAVESYVIHHDSEPPDVLSQLTTATPRIVRRVPADPFQAGSVNYVYMRSANRTYYVVFSHGDDRAADIASITNTGALTVVGGGDHEDDIFVTNGTGTL